MANKGMKFPAEILDKEDIRKLFAEIDTSVAGLRNRALFTVYLYSGLRCSEALDLRPCDLDLDQGTLLVRSGKGGKRRAIGFPTSKAEPVRHWMKTRRALGSDYLFCGIAGGRICSSYVRKIVKQYSDRAGTKRRVHPHAFRHTFACALADAKVDIRIISHQLGHSNIAVTDRYLRHLRPAAVYDAINAIDWD